MPRDLHFVAIGVVADPPAVAADSEWAGREEVLFSIGQGDVERAGVHLELSGV
jgi:hypothetical protein